MSASHPIDSADVEALLSLNNEHAAELSMLDAERFRQLATRAWFARSIGAKAFIFAFDQDARYDSPNFLWFRERYARFIYVDRIAVASDVRGGGYARCLYGELFEAARDAGHTRIVCEVNVRPANPVSAAFHARLGFGAVGHAELRGGEKVVQYLERRLDPSFGTTAA